MTESYEKIANTGDDRQDFDTLEHQVKSNAVKFNREKC